MSDTEIATRCDACESLEARVKAIEDEMTAAKEQGAAMLAKIPRPMRKALGIAEPD